MRFLLGLVLLVTLAPALSAQQVRLKLQDGRVVVGQLVAVTDDAIEIRVGESVVKVGVNEVADFSEVAVDPEQGTPPTDPPSTGTPPTDPPPTEIPPTTPPVEAPSKDPPVTDPAAADPPPTALDAPAPVQDPPAPGGASPTAGTPTPQPVSTEYTRKSRLRYAERLGWIPARYTWISPDHTPSVLSMLVLLVLVLGTSIHFGTRAANIEFRSYGRSCLLSVLVVVAGGVQIGFVPVNPISLGCMVVGNLVAWMVLCAGLYQASRFSSIVTAVVTVLCMLVSFMLLEVVDSLFGMVNDGIGREW